MKKALLSIVVIIVCISLSAAAQKVCIYPENQQLSLYLKENFSIITKHSSTPISEESLLSGNEKILEYVCKASDSDFLIIPSVTDLGGFNLYQVRVFDSKTGNFELVYEHLTEDSQIPLDVLYALQPYLSDTPVNLKQDKKTDTSEHIEYRNLPVNSDIPSDVYLNGEYVGKTPFVLTSYQVPSLILFQSEGYNDLVVKLNGELSELNVSLKSVSVDPKEVYNYSRDRFYRSLTNLLLSFGVRAAVPAFANTALPLYKALNIGSYGLLGFTAADSICKLFEYYKNAKEVSP